MSDPKTIKKRKSPVDLTDRLASEIAERYAAGEALHVILKDDHMPARGSVYRWLEQNHGGLRDTLAPARQAKGEWHAEQGLAQFDDLDDARLVELGKVASAAVGLRDKRANYHKWLGGCLNDRYADKVNVKADVRVNVLSAFLDLSGTLVDDREDAAVEVTVMPKSEAPDEIQEDS